MQAQVAEGQKALQAEIGQGQQAVQAAVAEGQARMLDLTGQLQAAKAALQHMQQQLSSEQVRHAVSAPDYLQGILIAKSFSCCIAVPRL